MGHISSLEGKSIEETIIHLRKKQMCWLSTFIPFAPFGEKWFYCRHFLGLCKMVPIFWRFIKVHL